MKEAEGSSKKFTRNGYEEGHPLSPRARKRFDSTVIQSSVPDIDSAKEILPNARSLYEGLGVPREDAKRTSRLVEQRLFEGTAHQQAAAADALGSLRDGREALLRNKN